MDWHAGAGIQLAALQRRSRSAQEWRWIGRREWGSNWQLSSDDRKAHRNGDGLARWSGDPIGSSPATIEKRTGMAMDWQAGVGIQLAALQRQSKSAQEWRWIGTLERGSNWQLSSDDREAHRNGDGLAGWSGDPIGSSPATIEKRTGMAMDWHAGAGIQLAALQRRSRSAQK